MPDVCLTELYDLPVIHSSFNCTIYDYNGQAAKVISQKNSSDPTLHKLFQEQAKDSYPREIRFQSLAGVGVAPKVHGLVWGLDHGGTMRIEGHIMDKCTLLERQVSTEEKHSIMRDMQQLLGRLHGQGILHGDVKLSNFVRDSDGALLLSDFETAAFISDSFVPSKSTARHTSPRRLQSPGLPLNMTDDIYALGIAVYHLFTNQLPFPEVEDEADADDKIRDATEPLDTSLIESAVVRGFVDRSLMVGKAVK